MKKLGGVLFILVLSAFFIATVSNSWAGKPSNPTPITASGYAKLDDANGVIQSDGFGQYADCSKPLEASITGKGEDYVNIIYYNDGNFQKINVVLGKMESFATIGTLSSRRLNLCFNILGGTKSNYAGNEAVYDILGQYYDKTEGKNMPRSTNTGFIDGNSVHAQIFAGIGGTSVICFLVDPRTDCSNDRAINDIKVNDFYDWDNLDLNYWDSSEYGECGQIIYTLNYTAGFDVILSSDKRTWTVTPKNGTVELSVKKYRRVNSTAKEIVLATYNTVPFMLTVSLDPFPIQCAPRKHATAATTWGDVRTAMNR